MRFFRFSSAFLVALLSFAAISLNIDSVTLAEAASLAGAATLAGAAKGFPTPAEATIKLKMGNARFVMGKSIHANIGPDRRRETALGGQHPFATLIACSDSRVPVELIFDAGIGDLFVIRVAGNICDTNEIGSIEFGVDYLETPLMVVMGHTGCIAVTAVVDGAELHGSIQALVNNIQPAARATRERYPGLIGPALVSKAIEMNVWQSIADLYDGSPATRERARKGTLRVLGAVYDIETGEVRWLGAHPDEKKLLGNITPSSVGHGAAPAPHAPPAAAEHAPPPQGETGHAVEEKPAAHSPPPTNLH